MENQSFERTSYSDVEVEEDRRSDIVGDSGTSSARSCVNECDSGGGVVTASSRMAPLNGCVEDAFVGGGISEEERLRRIDKYKEMIKSLEATTSVTPSTSRTPLHPHSAPSSASLPKYPKDQNQNKDLVLLNSFVVSRKRHRVYLNCGILIWDREKRSNGTMGGGGGGGMSGGVADSLTDPKVGDRNRHSVAIEDIIAIHVPKAKRKCSKNISSGNNNNNNSRSASEGKDEPLDDTLSPAATTFQVHYARRRNRNANMWKNVRVSFYNSDPRIIEQWVAALQQLLRGIPNRPHHILVFVNPYGGKRMAMTIYNRVAKPLFILAGIDVSLVVTQRANQITDIIMNNYLSQYDGIVAVGGDGTFNELYNGLVRREMADQQFHAAEKEEAGNGGRLDISLPKPKMPIGMIPGGSTNTISYCLNGTDDVQTSVLNIVLGKVDGMDLSSVHRNSNDLEMLRLYASVVSYGYLGDLTKEAENYRHLGPKRYDYVGVKKFLKNSGYEGEIKILLDDGAGSGAAGTHSNRIDDGDRCLEHCDRCKTARSNCGAGDGLDGRQSGLEDGDKWKVIRGKYFMISGANLTCACDRSPQGLSPYCHIGDGCLDLILVKHSSFFNNLRLASRLSGTGRDISSLPFVEMYRTKAFTFSVPDGGTVGGKGPIAEAPSINASTVPINSDSNSSSSGGGGNGNNGALKKSCWNCDGEVIEETELLVRTHCQLVQVYRSGIRGGMKKDCLGCGLC